MKTKELIQEELNNYIEIAKHCKYYKSMSSFRKEVLHLRLEYAVITDSYPWSSRYDTTNVMQNMINSLHLSTYKDLEEDHSYYKRMIMKATNTFPEISKAEEIALLEKLCYSQSYFGDYFRKHLETMKQNIQNDLPIELGIL